VEFSVYTGTPAGVGSVQRGDVMRGGVENVGEIEIKVV
jgi:fumarylpyruvate hydrolase